MERARWGESRLKPLGKCLTEVDAALFYFSMTLPCHRGISFRTELRRAEVVIKSTLALGELQDPRPWVMRTTSDARRHSERAREEGGAVAIT